MKSSRDNSAYPYGIYFIQQYFYLRAIQNYAGDRDGSIGKE
jgi:hypothetical protein